MEVLIVKTSSMGDILHTLPSLTDASRIIPEIRFDWVVEEDFVQIPNWHFAVNKVIPIAIRRWRKSLFSRSVKIEIKRFINNIRAKHYDAIIDAQGLIKSALLISSLATGVKHGMNRKSVREFLASLFYNKRYYIEPQQHAVERIRELFSKSLGYTKPNTYGEYAIAHKLVNNFPLIEEKPYIMFVHTSTHSKKLWPEIYWRNLISLMEGSGIIIKLPWWHDHEQKKAERLATGFSHVKVLPKLSLIQIAKQLAGSRIVVSIDTGLSHLAAALGKSNITIFGPTNPKLIGGYGKNQNQMISPTGYMNGITAERIYLFLQKKLNCL